MVREEVIIIVVVLVGADKRVGQLLGEVARFRDLERWVRRGGDGD